MDVSGCESSVNSIQIKSVTKISVLICIMNAGGRKLVFSGGAKHNALFFELNIT